MVGMLGLLCWLAGAGEPAREPRKARLFMLYSSTVFSNVKQADALAALKVWAQAIGKQRGFLLETEAYAFDRLEEAQMPIQEDAVDVVVFDTLEYLRNPQAGKLDPEFVAGREHDTAPDDYVVVARRDRNLTALEHLRGKSVMFYKIGADWGRLWMEAMLDEGGLGSAGDFFGSISESTKPSSVILPVFFGKCDAGVAKREGLNTMMEMNPQLAAQLRILTNSPILPEFVVCVHKNFKVFRDDLLKGLAELHTEPRGQQLLLLFKIDRLERFKPEHLDAAQELLARRARAKPSPARAEAVRVSTGKPQS
jgi:ABC-type phosphate/phosphonate transport system substrate-binding protein